MAPPSATTTETETSVEHPTTPSKGYNKPDAQPKGTATHEPGLTQHGAQTKMISFPKPPTFQDKYEEREYQKGRLALAFRIFGKLGFEEGVAGHITLRDPVNPHNFWGTYNAPQSWPFDADNT